MAIYLKNSWNVPPACWGSPADVQYAIRINSEKVYNCNPDNDVLVMPLFWGLPPLDYSGLNNLGFNYGSVYKNHNLNFDGNDYVSMGNPSCLRVTSNFTISVLGNTVNGHLVEKALGNSRGWGIYPFATYFAFGIKKDTSSNYWLKRGHTVTTDNKIHSVATSYVGDGTEPSLYADGIPQILTNVATKGDALSGFTDSGTSFNIGRNHLFRSDAFNYATGYINEVRISNVIRTPEQIALFSELPYGLYQKVSRPYYLLPIVAPTTTAPTTVPPTTIAPTTGPATTVPPTTFYPTEPPTSGPATTTPPTTLAPTTPFYPTTLAPTTLWQTTLGPTTLVPTTLKPTTLAPTTSAPTTLLPTTLAPTTLTPTSLVPTTLAPTTLAPTSLVPTTLEPTTLVPTTLAPTTIVSTTFAPTTLYPTTLVPTTIGPTTSVPTTAIPLICVKNVESTITDEIISKSFIANQLLLESSITKELRIHGNLC